jgi:hypothetical protein
MKKKYLWFFGIILLCIGCNSEKLNGHYHLLWNKNIKQFQTWNIRDNRMKINEDVCSISDSCFTSKISFNGNTITVNPWVDIEFTAKYKIDKQGIVTMIGNNDTLWLIPSYKCITTKKYLENKTNHLTGSLNLLSDIMTGKVDFPQNYENELIVMNSKDEPLYILNNQKIQKSGSGGFGIKNVNNENVWIYVDNLVPIQSVLPIVEELFEKGYNIQYSTIQERENNEQIKLINRSFKNFKTSKEQFEIDYCEFCTKHKTNKIDSIVNIKMLEVDKYVMNGKTDDLFQIRNSLVRYIIQNRITRLNTQIEIEINGETPFADYLTLIDELNQVHIETRGTTYKGENDPDAEWIRKKQWSPERQVIFDEFPIRIKEKIKITAPNTV